MSSSARAGSVNSRAWSTVTQRHLTDGQVSTVSVGEDFAMHLLQVLVQARTADEVRRSVAPETGPDKAVGSAGSLEIMLMTSMRKPSIPRSSHHRIIA